MTSDQSEETLSLDLNETTEFEPPHRRPGRSQLVLIAACVALAAFLVGITAGILTRPAADEVVVASKAVGPEGGVVRFDDGEISIPEGALADGEQIVVRRSAFTERIKVSSGSTDLAIPPGGVVAHRFEPAGLAFEKPVRITLRLEERTTNAAAFARRGNDIVLLSGTLDVDRRALVVEVDDFTFAQSSSEDEK